MSPRKSQILLKVIHMHRMRCFPYHDSLKTLVLVLLKKYFWYHHLASWRINVYTDALTP